MAVNGAQVKAAQEITHILCRFHAVGVRNMSALQELALGAAKLVVPMSQKDQAVIADEVMYRIIKESTTEKIDG